jgi:hypothetical protein
MTSKPRTNPPHPKNTLDDDGESDDEFPAPIPGEKGLKVENIHTLKHGGGFVNYPL